MEKKLSVKDLTISFRTTNGKVQAVRGIDFELNKGETLAIVGESGSGKSVTSKAILGILAGNSIVEGGEIIYDGKDLLKISEEDFHKIRGDKIAMIFQDPMSSLNPIVKIGRQLTEAMILKGKARQKESKINFNATLAKLNAAMADAIAKGDAAKAKALEEKCKNFDKFEYKHIELESAYNIAHEGAIEANEEAKQLIFEIEKNGANDLKYRLGAIKRDALDSVHTYVVDAKKDEITKAANELLPIFASCKKSGDYSPLIAPLSSIRDITGEAMDLPAPNFFALGYFYTYGNGQKLPDMPVPELNSYLRKYLDDNFMLGFIADAKQGLMLSANKAYDKKVEAIKALKEHRDVFCAENLDKKACLEAHKLMSVAVNASIDRLELIKDSFAYTFEVGVKADIEKYFVSIGKNAKEEARYAKEQAKYEKMVAAGRSPDWKVKPAALTSLEQVKKNILNQIDRLIAHYEEALANRENRDFDKETVAMIDYLKANASGVVHKVTPDMAKHKAIKLMEEVGIPEPRKRYKQYPFEFSGGMRQRIVIAIALAADPDILICDEPTTALDVTIQSQILELINKIKDERQLSIIFITHDLGVVANMADRIAVMYAGKIVEYGTADDIFYDSRHPYTWALLSSMPDLDTEEKLDAIPGTPPNMIYPPKGDAFAARNKYAMVIDFEEQPPMFEVSESHHAATWLLHPDAPKVEPPKIVTDRIARMQGKGGNDNA